jgi:hypothetical protein
LKERTISALLKNVLGHLDEELANDKLYNQKNEVAADKQCILELRRQL